jgi:hypothetical protein
MFGEAQKPILPHPRNAEYRRERKRQFPISCQLLVRLLTICAASMGAAAMGSGFTLDPPGLLIANQSATDGAGPAFNGSAIPLTISGANTLLIAAWHSEYDGGEPDWWRVEYAGIPGTVLTDTNGYTGGDGNRRFRIYYWSNPPAGNNTLLVTNSYSGGNELAVSAIVLTNVAQAVPLGAVVLDVSTNNRTGESETVFASTNDLVVHVIADQFFIMGALGSGESSVSIANDGHHQWAGDASLWVSTKAGDDSSTTVSSSGWPSGVINGVAIVVHGNQSQSPSISAIPDQATISNLPVSAIAFTIADPNTPVTNLSLSGRSSDEALVPNANIVFGGQGTNRTVTVTPAADQVGIATITITVSDGEASDSTCFDLVVNGPPITGLVAAYSFDEGGGSTASDASGNGNQGTVLGAAWTSSGKHGSALVFNGFQTNWVTVDDSPSLDFTNAMTLEAWVYTEAFTSDWGTILMKEGLSDFAYMLQLDPEHQLNTYILDPSGLSGVAAPAEIPINSWHHVAGTFDGTVLCLYVDGNLVASQSLSGSIVPSTGPLRIGGNSIWGEYFDGVIDDVRVYNRALSQLEIQLTMNAAVTSPPAVLLQALPQASGNIAADGFRLQVTLNSPTALAVERSKDFLSWQAIAVIQPTNGVVEITDSQAGGSTSYFYRTRAL